MNPRGISSSLTISLEPPTAAEFIAFRAACGWGQLDHDTAQSSLSNSIIDVSCRHQGQLAGFGRVVGDGVLYFYLQDIIVAPEFRGQAVGRTIVGALLDAVLRRAPKGATIGLMSAYGKEDFYEHFGFERRPSSVLGAGMTQFIME